MKSGEEREAHHAAASLPVWGEWIEISNWPLESYMTFRSIRQGDQLDDNFMIFRGFTDQIETGKLIIQTSAKLEVFS